MKICEEEEEKEEQFILDLECFGKKIENIEYE